MVKFSFALICLLLLQLSKASCQTNWKYFDNNLSNDLFYFDSLNTKQTESTILVWVKYEISFENQEKELIMNENTDKKFYDIIQLRHLIDFKNHKYKILHLNYYLDQTLVESPTDDSLNYWLDIIPDSNMEFELLAVKKFLNIKN